MLYTFALCLPQGKCEDQLATIQVTQRSLCRTEKELQQLQSELDRTINERVWMLYHGDVNSIVVNITVF